MKNILIQILIGFIILSSILTWKITSYNLNNEITNLNGEITNLNGEITNLNGEIEEKSTSNIHTIFSYKKYRELVTYLSNNLIINEFEMIHSTNNLHMAIIDKDFPLNEETHYTKSGSNIEKFSLSDKMFISRDGTDSRESVQERIMFKGLNEETYINIDIIYTNNYIDERVMSYFGKLGSPLYGAENKNEMLSKKSNILISYKNILFVIHETSVYDATYEQTKSICKDLEEVLLSFE